MSKLALHPTVVLALDQYLQDPAQAFALVGQNGVGKGALLQLIVEQLLHEDVVELSNHPSVVHLGDNDALNIDEVRRIQRFLTLRPADADKPRRLIIIEHAERLTPEAQNALLKLIEEPPLEAFVAFTVSSSTALLPTVMSRLQTIRVTPPDSQSLHTHFRAQGNSQEQVQRALLLSGGLPGATAALLGEEDEHPLLSAVQTARQFLQVSRFERLAQIDKLSRDREIAIQVCDVLAQMASVSLHRSETTGPQLQRWQAVLGQALTTAKILRRSGQTKLALMSMALKI